MPNSPHLQASKTKAQFLIAIAANDDMRSPKDKDVLKETFAKANLPAEIEVYTGSAHGWCPPDSQVYNEPHGREGLEPFARAVRKSSGLNIELTSLHWGTVPRIWRLGEWRHDGPRWVASSRLDSRPLCHVENARYFAVVRRFGQGLTATIEGFYTSQARVRQLGTHCGSCRIIMQACIPMPGVVQERILGGCRPQRGHAMVVPLAQNVPRAVCNQTARGSKTTAIEDPKTLSCSECYGKKMRGLHPAEVLGEPHPERAADHSAAAHQSHCLSPK